MKTQQSLRPSIVRPQSHKRVLNAGSGPRSARQLHPVFAADRWEEVRFDIDPRANPDVVGSITETRKHFTDRSFDAVWCSHALEHLYAHEVPVAVSELRHILKADGFALIRSPDVEIAASLLLEHGGDYIAYRSPAGPITPLDLLFGHSASIARGMTAMCHHTGFTCAVLGQRLLEAGFPTVLATRDRFVLWALALMERADQTAIQNEMLAAGINLFEAAGSAMPANRS
jgi:SAM-dependent methyltransferase